MTDAFQDAASDALDRNMLDRAARAALRAAGRVEPNPMVGCVIGREDGTILATAHHERFGGVHAEADALAVCKARGIDVRGATVWVTLEPCNHIGKTPSCTIALQEAGVARVVYAVRDPNPLAQGGAEALRQAGIHVRECRVSALACGISRPFVKRMQTGHPWVIAKWAQTRDGFVSMIGGEPRWISNAYSRRDVHRLRGRMDAIITGIGTVLADDPLLTARDVCMRRMARRVIIDRQLNLPMSSAMVNTARAVPTLVVTSEVCLAGDRSEQLREAGVTVLGLPEHEGGLDLGALLQVLARDCDATNVLLEAGPRLIGSFGQAGLIDEAWLYEAPLDAGDRGDRKINPRIVNIPEFACVHEKNMQGDARRIYRAVN